MKIETLIQRHPHVYHVAEAGSWPSIRRHGLLSTSALLDLYEKKGEERERIEARHRPENLRIAHERHGSCVIRDQKPLRPAALEHCLDGMSAEEWFRLLNGFVFLWPTEDRLTRFLNAGAYGGRAHDVLTLDTRRLLERHSNSMVLSSINSGSTLYKPAKRGRETFRTVAEYQSESGGRKRAIAELAVLHGLPHIEELTTRAVRQQGNRVDAVLFDGAVQD